MNQPGKPRKKISSPHTRLIAQHAASVEEGIRILRESKRMRGQIIWLAQDADVASGRPARAVAVEYDAAEVVARESKDGVLIVTNTNLAFGTRYGDEDVYCFRYRRLRRLIEQRHGALKGTEWLTEDPDVRVSSTFHVVQVHPRDGVFMVKHRDRESGLGPPRRFMFPGRE